MKKPLTNDSRAHCHIEYNGKAGEKNGPSEPDINQGSHYEDFACRRKAQGPGLSSRDLAEPDVPEFQPQICHLLTTRPSTI